MLGYIGYENDPLTPTTVTGIFDLNDQRSATIESKWPFGGIVPDGLVLYLDAANKNSYPGSGTSWADLSNTDLDALLVGGTAYTTNNQGSFLFDSVDDYADLGNQTSWNSFGNQITIECVFKLTGNLANFPRIMSKQFATSAVTANSCFQIGVHSDQTFRFSVYTETGGLDSRSVVANLNQIYHFVGTYDGSTLKRYVNAVEIGSGALSGNIRTSIHPLSIGATLFNGVSSNRFAGEIYTIRMYNKSLSLQEIQQNFNAIRGRYGL